MVTDSSTELLRCPPSVATICCTILEVWTERAGHMLFQQQVRQVNTGWRKMSTNQAGSLPVLLSNSGPWVMCGPQWSYTWPARPTQNPGYSWQASILQYLFCEYYKSQNALLHNHDRTFMKGFHYCDFKGLLIFNFSQCHQPVDKMPVEI